MGKRMNKKNAEQSKIQLWNSLIELLETNSYAELTIKKIVQHSGFSRKTFYKHFKRKDDLFDYGCRRMFNLFIQDYTQSLPVRQDRDYYFKLLIDFHWKQKLIIRLLIKRKIYQRFIEILQNQVTDFNLDYQIISNSRDPLKNKFRVSFIVGGISGTLVTWLSGILVTEN
ncbi:TetR family transcriptional regulator [Xylocopilactobacillus apicola]|uniref:TetR family transcriptional regulator n=2 Tax=Xylocopilactobacillus apicola TaxID=2932184 RepID=A0AAU9DM55_9LACO|nr:TetR family transcriptional regulator [Xylocopilactobacillus apicola]